MLKVVHDEAEPNEASGSVLDEIVREAARHPPESLGLTHADIGI